MAKFYGSIGYAKQVESPANSGIWVKQVTERSHYGDVLANNVQQQETENLNNDLKVSNRVSLVLDPYLRDHVSAIVYISWFGARWTVREIEVREPRLIVKFGGLYNGPTPEASGPAEDSGDD